MWSSYVPSFLEAAKGSPYLELSVFSHKMVEQSAECLEAFMASADQADVLLFYWTADGFWEEISSRLAGLKGGTVIVTTSPDPSSWGREATVDLSVCARVYTYLSEGGCENYRRLLEFVAHHANPDIPIQDPLPLPWQGLLRPPDPSVYPSVESFRKKYADTEGKTVGLFFSRHTFINSDTSLEEKLILALEKEGLDVLPVFSHGTADAAVGALGPVETARRFFFDHDGNPIISALVNMHYFFLGRESGSDISESGVATRAVDLFRDLNVPVFKPVISYSKSVEEWEEDPQGLTAEVSFGIALPEFEGNVEPLIAACSCRLTDNATDTVFEVREAIMERLNHIAERIAGWIRLAETPPSERKAVFVFHKNECAGLEAGIGGAGGLDSGESVIRIMERMKSAGYRIEHLPESGEELMQMILERKATAEFRWTTVEEIVAKGGHLALLDSDIYRGWFDELPQKSRSALVEAWGEPPGQEMNGVPAAMVLDGKLVLTGLNFGNVNVMMQPKRGCAGSRCDGEVCKILHDPDIPPPHQYLATYMYMDRIFQANVVIHVGTHGNLEWMPGKGAGLSDSCWPDIAIGRLPNLYIYNADNPAEGAVAKRRSYAVLVDHMQAIMNTSGTYGGLAELEDLLNEYARTGDKDRARGHQLEHLIKEKVTRNHLLDDSVSLGDIAFPQLVTHLHEVLSGIRNSQTRIGMHVFGREMGMEDRVALINTILRFDSGGELNSRRMAFEFWQEDFDKARREPGTVCRNGKSGGEMLFAADLWSSELISRLVSGKGIEGILAEAAGRGCKGGYAERLERFSALVREINRRITDSAEIDSLLNAMDGGYVPSGPSGYVSRGRYDILPTGRNFYNVDPTRIPSQAAYRVGIRIAEALLRRYLDEEGRYPESVGMVWLAADIMRADGEQIGQIMHLLGARPKWKANGQVEGFEIIPATELDRPRIDVNIRVSGITRDCFPDAVTYLDQVIQAVALLKEEPESNFLRKHIMSQAAEKGISLQDPGQLRRLSYRIFCAQPGVYRAGVNLAVAASAWKTEEDLSDVYVYWNGYAYGGASGSDSYGVRAHKELVDNLRRVEVTFDKHISDEGDFLNCCGFYGNYGGMTAAVRAISGKSPHTYYGDTRDPANPAVTDFSDELRRVVRTKLLHPAYLEGMKAHGYKGAGDLSKRIGRVYGFGATTRKVDNWIFDEIAETFILDPEMKEWFEKVNPWALEEIGRRLMEAEGRGIWRADPKILERLKEAYLDVEACLEETVGETRGDFQGGAVDVITAAEVENWKTAIQAMKDEVGEKHD